MTDEEDSVSLLMEMYRYWMYWSHYLALSLGGLHAQLQKSSYIIFNLCIYNDCKSGVLNPRI